ncbi:ADI_G0032020.mRNA.1.CDS.1 [Saccharomyces cerevisiae]|nr:ADI_G0032020.mRNA.1.CDS.1 [Saccharomyces cerevisiae]CAI6630124.1 ADI_G0032020.mRNA.1.CDS.1 [Saccharomyces cerevisiae]
MMPAKLQLDILRTPAVQRLSWNANAEKLPVSRAPLQRPYRLLPPILPGTFFVPVQKVLQHLRLRFTQVAPYFKIQLFDLPSRHAENSAPLLASCRIQYTNCFSSSSNSQVPSIISLYPRVDLSLFTLKYFKYPTGSP